MPGTTRWFASLLTGAVLATPLFVAHATDQSAAPTPVPHRHKTHKKQAPLVLPPLPAGPLRQVPMDQLPAAAPRVTYQNGLLAIAAQNSTLGEILREVRRLTGASIELPPNGAPERVVTQIGPGAPRDVLALLLNGTALNYVMLGSTSDPNAVATILLSPRPSTGELQTATNANQPVPVSQPGPMQPPMPFRGAVGPTISRTPPEQPPAAEAEDNSDDSDADDKDDDSDQAQPGQPAQAVVNQPDSNVNQPDSNQPNAGPRTPEQLLQMMRQGQHMVPPQQIPQQNPPQE